MVEFVDIVDSVDYVFSELMFELVGLKIMVIVGLMREFFDFV